PAGRPAPALRPARRRGPRLHLRRRRGRLLPRAPDELPGRDALPRTRQPAPVGEPPPLRGRGHHPLRSRNALALQGTLGGPARGEYGDFSGGLRREIQVSVFTPLAPPLLWR